MLIKKVLLLILPVLAQAEPLNFNRDVRSILSENCFYCHGVDGNKREADLHLDVRKDVLACDVWPYKSVINGFHRDHPSA
jgi:hypothetical protein